MVNPTITSLLMSVLVGVLAALVAFAANSLNAIKAKEEPPKRETMETPHSRQVIYHDPVTPRT